MNVFLTFFKNINAVLGDVPPPPPPEVVLGAILNGAVEVSVVIVVDGDGGDHGGDGVVVGLVLGSDVS